MDLSVAKLRSSLMRINAKLKSKEISEFLTKKVSFKKSRASIEIENLNLSFR